MTHEQTKEYTTEEKARFWEEAAKAEEEFGADTFCPDIERHRQRWQRRKDKLLAQIADAKTFEQKERLQQKLLELERACKSSAEALADLIGVNKLNK